MTGENKHRKVRASHASAHIVTCQWFSFSETEGTIHCHTRPSVLPIMFIMTAESAGGKATKDEEKCAVANTTAKDEFCIPTCNPEKKTLQCISNSIK